MIFSIDNNNLSIEALAGSVSRGNKDLNDISNINFILNDKKINDEHDIVVKGILESLKELQLKFNCSDKSVLTLKNIMHLQTLIRAKIENFNNPLYILNLLSPTPALSGYPKKESIKLINKIEDYDRGWYTGSIGWIDTKFNCNFYAGLRSILINENKLYIYGGAGITKDSLQDEEWHEILYKINSIEEMIYE